MLTSRQISIVNIEESEKLNLEIHTKDEIESLSKSFEEMSTEIKDYITELSAVTAEKERIGAELNIATEIQAGFLPLFSRIRAKLFG